MEPRQLIDKRTVTMVTYDDPPDIPAQPAELERTPERKPWLKMKDEPDRWFSRFQIYLSLGPKRSLPQAQRVERGKAVKSSAGSWCKASARWKWLERAHSHDVAMATKTVEKIESSIDKASGAHEVAYQKAAELVAEVLSHPDDVTILKRNAPALAFLLGKGQAMTALAQTRRSLVGEKTEVTGRVGVDMAVLAELRKTINLIQD